MVGVSVHVRISSTDHSHRSPHHQHALTLFLPVYCSQDSPDMTNPHTLTSHCSLSLSFLASMSNPHRSAYQGHTYKGIIVFVSRNLTRPCLNPNLRRPRRRPLAQVSGENEGAKGGEEGETTPDRTRGGSDVDSCALDEESTGERGLPGLGSLVILPCRGEVANVPLALLGSVPRRLVRTIFAFWARFFLIHNNFPLKRLAVPVLVAGFDAFL